MFQTCAGKCDCVCMESERTGEARERWEFLIWWAFKINLLFIGILLGVFIS